MRGDINFKVSDSSDLSVYFLFCALINMKPKNSVKRTWDVLKSSFVNGITISVFQQETFIFKAVVPTQRPR